MSEPLAARIRPTSLADFVGQAHLVGAGKPLHEAIEKQHQFSFILWGPPGVGKTTLARMYAQALDAAFYELSAVSAGKADVKKIIDTETDKPKVLFLDEIHRFNKAQQDYLLPYVESGEITLIGATTENPSFEIIGALLSRCRVFTLNTLSDDEMRTIVGRTSVPLDEHAVNWLIAMAAGDARQMLSVIDATSALYNEVTVDTLKEALQNQHLRYDKAGEEHYNTISAFIKSMRASDPNAALYYLVRMTEAGENPTFIARRMVVFASEDIGMAQPTALVVANEVFRAVETIGYPECTINLAHGVVYLATAKKDRRAYDGLRAAEADVRQHGNLPIPKQLRNAPTTLMKESGYGHGYEMYPQPGTNLLPDKLTGTTYYKEQLTMSLPRRDSREGKQ
jgi:putative ATPase